MKKLLSSENSEKKEGGGILQVYRGLFDFLEVFAYAFILVIVIITFLVRHSPVEGSSMVSTLENGDLLLVSPIGTDDLKTGDIIVFQTPGLGYETPLVKRVIATGGQKLYIDYDKWEVYVDDVKLDETYLENEPQLSQKAAGQSMCPYQYRKTYDFPVTVPEGYIFVMGDNRTNSRDSRDSDVGFVDTRFVFGKVFFRVFPFDKFGSLAQ